MLIYQTRTWETIIKNIALKDGDYPGTKNITRMRNAIVTQSEFVKGKKDEEQI